MALLLIREQGASNVIGKPTLRACLLLGVAMTAMRCSGQENLSKCRSVDPDTRIAGCTALIQTGQLTTGNLSTIYNNRGTAYSSKGDHDRAIQDYNEAIRLRPDFALAYEERGDSYFVQSNLTAAIASFEHVISAAPSSRTAVVAALVLHVAMKRQGHDDAQQLAPVAAAADLSKWPGRC
jgi:tetratricopeptide (TPR) repeat protein